MWKKSCHQVAGTASFYLFIDETSGSQGRSIYVQADITRLESLRPNYVSPLSKKEKSQRGFLPSERTQCSRRFVGWNDRWMGLFEADVSRPGAHAWQQARASIETRMAEARGANLRDTLVVLGESKGRGMRLKLHV